MKVNEVAKLTGVTVRTLHYYDEIGLLQPREKLQSGYRVYDGESLDKLQQILFFRELDFSLHEIKEIINNPDYDREKTLVAQKGVLREKRKRLDRMIQLLDETIKGEKSMSFQAFDMTEIERAKKEYAEEIKVKYEGTKEYKESHEKTSRYGENEWKEIEKQSKELFRKFSEYKMLDANDEKVQLCVSEWQQYITEHFYECTDEILQGLGAMYVEDERFRKNIDKYGEGTAEFLSRAIHEFVTQKQR